MLDNPWFDCVQEQRTLIFSSLPDRLFRSPTSYSVGKAGLPPGCKAAGARATPITSICSIFKMSGAIPLPPYTPSWTEKTLPSLPLPIFRHKK
jgi:hypothetical protein